ncbi:MAG: UvrD-helicase domain-containing protein, partial [Planctomycetota bacterium]
MKARSDGLTLTSQQTAALETRGCSVSLAAGAGCGKTFVLTERFLSHVDPLRGDAVDDLHELVAITFTDAAAREMRERIRARCYEELSRASEPRRAAAWQRLMRAMESARISTIHSFCADLLRKHYVEAELDPQFEILDAASADSLRRETVDEYLRTRLREGDQRVVELAVPIGLDRLRNDLTRWCCDATIDIAESWQEGSAQRLVEHWRRYFLRNVVGAASAEILNSVEMRSLIALAEPERTDSERLRERFVALHAAIAQFAALVSDDRGATTLESATQAAANLHALARVQGVCTKKDWRDDGDFSAYSAACKGVRETLAGSILIRNGDDESTIVAAQRGLTLLQLAGEASSAAVEAKRKRGQLEYDDLLVRAHRLLTDPRHRGLQ